MNLIVVTDIFGETSELHDLISALSEAYKRITIVSPYPDSEIPFVSKDDAYQAFQQQCGLEGLAEKLKTEIAQQDERFDILGFSVGGACAWCISGEGQFEKIRKIICFYGSRIRDSLEIIPEHPTSIIFPKFEAGFEIEPVVMALSEKRDIEIVRTDYLHGFMNKKLTNYSEKGYQQFVEWLVEKAV